MAKTMQHFVSWQTTKNNNSKNCIQSIQGVWVSCFLKETLDWQGKHNDGK